MYYGRRPPIITIAPSRPDLSPLIALIEQRYGTRDVKLTPFYEESEKAVYRVDHRSGNGAPGVPWVPWVLRYFSPTRAQERVAGDARILRHLERELARTVETGKTPASYSAWRTRWREADTVAAHARQVIERHSAGQ